MKMVWLPASLNRGKPTPSGSATPSKVPFVIGAGLPRTGTLSFKAALDRLGYKAIHMAEFFDGHLSIDPFYELARKERAAGEKDPARAKSVVQYLIDQGYTATADFPNDFLYQEYLELVPDAKVILTIRKKPGDWRRSVMETIGQITFPFSKAPFSFSPFFRGFVNDFDPWCWERMGGIAELGEMSGPESIAAPEFERKMEKAYEHYVETVKATVPAEKLLVFHPSDGYKPFCRFLEISDSDCPNEAFPYVNDKDEALAFINTFTRLTQVFWPAVGLTALLLGVLYRKATSGRKAGKKAKKN